MLISAIIPILNEERYIKRLVDRLMTYGRDILVEIIVIDGGSIDDSIYLAKAAGAKVLIAPQRGRAAQMNYGALRAKGNFLYFVHADTLPPKSYIDDIQKSVQEGFLIGCYRSSFESKHPLLKINAYFTRFDQLWCRGGDQTLFIQKTIFEELEGFKPMEIMEEYDFLERARQQYSFKIIPKSVSISARKYESNGYFRVQIGNLMVFNMYKWGYPQQKLVSVYKRIIKNK